MTVLDVQNMLGSQRKRDPPGLGEDALERSPHLFVFNTYTSSTPDDCRSQNTSRSYKSSYELDEEIAMISKRCSAKEPVRVDEVYHPRSVDGSTAGSESDSYSAVEDEAASRNTQEMKMMEELKVVRHLTRPIQADLISMISERSRISKRKPRRKRGDSLERDISRTILQTADVGAIEAHFLLESSNTECHGEEKGANFILSDLDQQNSDILAIDEVVNQLPSLDHQATTAATTASGNNEEEILEQVNQQVDISQIPKVDPPEVLPKADPPVEEQAHAFDVDIMSKLEKAGDTVSQQNEIEVISEEEREFTAADEDEDHDEVSNFGAGLQKKSNALQRRLAAAAESRRSATLYPVTPSHEDSRLSQLVHPDPSLQDITFSSTSASEEKQIDDFEFFEDNKFGNMDDYNDDQWTNFGDSPFSVSDKQMSMASSFKMTPPRDVADEQPTGRRRSSVQPRRSIEKSQPVSPSRLIMQPRSPASVRDLRFNADNGDSEFDINY